MTTQNNGLALWNRMSGLPMGKWLFPKLVCFKAPYFGSIAPRFQELRHGYCRVALRNRRAVHNHIGTVHAIAMCNLAEITAGTLIETTLPTTHRWIPKGMTVEYLKKAATDLIAVAELNPVPAFAGPQDLPITVTVKDAQDQAVFRAVISMWITPRKAAAG